MRAREAVSAMMDGEASGRTPEQVEDHLAGCAACSRWRARAARADRLARVAPADESDSNLTESVLANVRLPRRDRWHRVLRAALVVAALAQLGIGLSNLFGPLGMHPGMSASAHMDHEEAAFNLAFGVAMLLVALNTRHALTHLPVLGSFVLVLATASVVDLLDGNVGWARLATHTPILAGLLLATALSRGPYAGRSPAATGPRTPPATQPTRGLRLDASSGERAADRRNPPAARRDVA